MSVLEIVLLIAGVVIIIASFVIPVKQEELKQETKQLAASEVKDLVREETETVKIKIESAVDDTVDAAVDKAERSMERVSNEKIMAVNEYSDTVLEEIHKNHQEVVFLYDMLNEKQDSLKKAVQAADQNVKKLLQDVKDSEITVKEHVAKIEQAGYLEPEIFTAEKPVKEDENTGAFEALKLEKVTVVPKKQSTRKTTAKAVSVKDAEKASKEGTADESAKELKKESPAKTAAGKAAPAAKTGRGRKTIAASKTAEPEMKVQISAPKKENGINSNERILELHKAGKSNMAVAKELGLGIGEVKLVIDLYEGLK